MARDVKPWTIYPATQEDREIIERKAAEAGLSVSTYLCLVGKLANISVDLQLIKQILSANLPEPALAAKVAPTPTPAETSYVITDQWGKPLSPEIEAALQVEYEAGRVDKQTITLCDSNGEPVRDVPDCNVHGTLYQCTTPDPDRGIDCGMLFRVRCRL